MTKTKAEKSWEKLINDPGVVFIGNLEQFLDQLIDMPAPKEVNDDKTDK
jgi:hypothetical protein